MDFDIILFLIISTFIVIVAIASIVASVSRQMDSLKQTQNITFPDLEPLEQDVISDILPKKRNRKDRKFLKPAEEDITCTSLEKHEHKPSEAEALANRYIVHEEPEEGYVVLNGVLRKIEDCKYL